MRPSEHTAPRESIYAPPGELDDLLLSDEGATTVSLAEGSVRNRLFKTGTTSIYAIYVNAVGAALS